MSFAGRPLLHGGSTSAGPIVVVSNNQGESNFPLSTKTILIVTILIVLVVILWTIYEVRKIPITTTELPVEPDILDLDSLIDLNVDGVCCVKSPNPIPNPTYIYDATTNFTYSTTKVTPTVACQAATGPANTTCLSYVTATDGTVKPLGHKGIIVYYPFSFGTTPALCTSYSAC